MAERLIGFAQFIHELSFCLPVPGRRQVNVSTESTGERADLTPLRCTASVLVEHYYDNSTLTKCASVIPEVETPSRHTSNSQPSGILGPLFARAILAFVTNSMAHTSYPRKRWLILTVAWGSFFAIAMAWYVMPTLQPEILIIYDISAAEFRLALTIPFLVAAVLAIPGGMIADRLGIRRAASSGIAIAGIGFVLRSHTAGLWSLLFAMMLVGVGMGLTMPNLPKLVSVWFPPEEAGLATGIYSTGLLGGISTGLVIAPYLPGWSSGNLLLGGLVLLLTIVFFGVVRDAPLGTSRAKSPLSDGIKRAVRSRNAWLAAIGVFGGTAGMVAIQGELPVGLLSVHGIPTVTGGRIAAVISYSALVGSLTIPVIATKLGRRRTILFFISIGFGIVILPVWITGGVSVLYVGSALAGYMAGGALPILLEVPTWLPRIESDPVGQDHVGGASGLLIAMLNLGGFIGLPLLVGPVIEIQGYTLGFLVAVFLFAFQGFFGLGIGFPEVTPESDRY